MAFHVRNLFPVFLFGSFIFICSPIQNSITFAETIILNKTCQNHTIISGNYEVIYGTSSANQITLECGAGAELFNFPGQNNIQIQSSSKLFKVSRSGSIVTFQGDNGTILKIPATRDAQTISFPDRTLTLTIYSNKIMLDDQAITAETLPIEASEQASPSKNIDGFWLEIPSSKLENVSPGNLEVTTSTGNCIYNFNGNVINPWSSAVYDSTGNRLILFGGGHGDYAGNEIYAFSLDNYEWTIIHGPSTKFGDTLKGGSTTCGTDGKCSNELPDGEPCSRHTYQGIVYLPDINSMFLYGGSQACGSGGFGTDTWLYSFDTDTWTKKNPAGNSPGPSVSLCVYNNRDGLVWCKTANSLHAYDPINNFWSNLGGDCIADHNYNSATIDATRNRMWIVSKIGTGTNSVYYIDLEGGDYSSKAVTAVASFSDISARSHGIYYDPDNDQLVCWGNSDATNLDSKSIYRFDIGTSTWLVETHSSGPLLNQSSKGTFGRWQYILDMNAYIAVSSENNNVWIYYPSGFPKNEWIPMEMPQDGTARCGDGSCKHIAWVYNSSNGKIYAIGGDGQYPSGGYYDSGRNEIHSYDVATNTWEEVQPYCREEGEYQPNGPDQTPTFYNPNTDEIWVMGGFHWNHSTSVCETGSILIPGDPPNDSSKTMIYNVKNDFWTVTERENPATYIKHAVYDPVLNKAVAFKNDAIVGVYDIALNSWMYTSFSATYGNAQITEHRPAIDVANHKVYALDLFQTPATLYVYDIQANTLEIESSDLPYNGASKQLINDQGLIFDSDYNVLIWPQHVCINAPADCSFSLHFYDLEKKIWITPEINCKNCSNIDVVVKGRNSFYDSVNHTLGILGVNQDAGWGPSQPYLFLFKYDPDSQPFKGL